MKSFAGLFVSVLLLIPLAVAQQPAVDHYSAADFAQMSKSLKVEASHSPDGLAGKTLQKYGNHLTMLSFRNKSGSAELHEHFADFFFVVNGKAKLVTGGTVVNPKTTSEGEIRGSSIESGKEQQLNQGDIVHIPANVPHQLLLSPGNTFTYFVIKVQQ
jgi:mannose-6-phosphate isomerase-like protein (cupin superfamily)